MRLRKLPPKFSQAHFLPSILIVAVLVVLFVLSIAHSIHVAAINATAGDLREQPVLEQKCTGCSIKLDDEQ